MTEVHGVDQRACLKQAGIDSILLEDNSGRVPIAATGSSSRIVSTDATCLRFDCHFADPLVRRHVTENVLASWDRFSSTYLHLMGYPLRIYFEHSAPDEDALLDIYRNTFILTRNIVEPG